MKSALTLSVLLAATSLLSAEPRDLVRIPGADRSAVRTVEQTGAWVNSADGEGIVAEATLAQQVRLRALGFAVRLLTPDVAETYERNFEAGCDLGQYLTYQQFVDTMRTIVLAYPGICRLETLGTSYGGRQLLAMKVSDNPNVHENEPAIHFEGDIHGDEKIGWAVAFEMLKYLVTRYGADTLVTRLVDTREVWLHPMYNPDGYVSSSRYNGNSVDLNRNWGWMWGNEAAMGASPFSEPENRALLDHIMRHPLVMFVSFHAGTEFISYPWSYSPDSAPEKRLLDFLSVRYRAPNNYDYGQGYQGMYPINGSTKDFDYGQGMMGWSIEVHMSKTPPANEIEPTFQKNRPAMLEFFHRAGQGIHGTVTDARTGRPVHCQAWVSPAGWPSFGDASLGDFHRFYLPGTYSVSLRAPGYRDTTLSGVVVPNSGDSSVQLEVQMTPDAASPLFAFRFIYSYYVDELSNHTYPLRALGPHDNDAFRLDNGKYICLDMDRPVQNGDGADLTVYRSSGSGSAQVQGSVSWQGPWTTIGTANAAQTSFDIGSAGLDSVRYVRFTASGQFFLDAVEGVNFTGSGEGNPAHAPTLAVSSNPARDRVVFLFRPGSPAARSRVFIRDVSGRATAALPAAGPIVVWSCRQVPAGVYFAELDAADSRPLRIVVAR